MKPCALLPALLLTAAAAAAPALREHQGKFELSGPGLALAVGKTDGVIEVRELGGVKPVNLVRTAARIGDVVCNARQLETAPPKLIWKSTAGTVRNAVEIVQKTRFDRRAGLDLDGVELTRILTVPDNGRLNLRYELHNPGPAPRYADFGVREEFFVSGNGRDRSYVPTENHVLDLGTDPALWNFYAKPGPWFFDLTAGWHATANHPLRQGVGTAFDYHRATGVYLGPDHRTRGVLFDGGTLPPGGKFVTALRIVPFKGLGSVYHVGETFVAGFDGEKSDVALGVIPLETAKFTGKLRVSEAGSGKTLGQFPLAFDASENFPRAFSFRIPAPSTQTVNRVELHGEQFEQYRENGFRLQGLPMVPLIVAAKRPAPPRTPPATGGAVAPEKRDNAILLIFGPYANFFRFEKIFDGAKFETVSAVPGGLRENPPAVTLPRYRAIVLGDVNIESIRGIQPRLIDYVRNGGTLITAGGPFAYGCGGYAGSALGNILPVESAPFDLRPAAGDGKFNVPAVGDIGEIYWLHKVKLRPGTETLLRAGDLPVLVRRTFGKGRVLSLLASPLGQGKAPFWDSPVYIRQMQTICKEAK